MSPEWRTRCGMLAGLLAAVLVLLMAAAPPRTAAGRVVDPEPLVPAAPGDDRAATLVAAEDARLLAVLRGLPFRTRPYLDRAHGAPTLVLPPAPTPYDLGSLVALGAATRTGTTVDLVTSVLVTPGARLRLEAPDGELRLASGPGGFTSIVAWDAELTVAGAPGHPLRVGSRDPSSGPDRLPDDGRAYLRSVGGRLDVSDAELTALGFRAGRTGGLAVTGHTDGPATATVSRTTVRDGEYGLFVTDARGVAVTDSVFTGHRNEGIRLHRDTRDVSVRRTSASGNGADGVIADRGSADVTLEDVDASDNAGWGVAIAASPLAARPDASGRPVGGTAGFLLRSVRTVADGRGGIELDGTTGLRLTGCAVTGVPVGVFVHGGTRDLDVASCTVVGAGRAGFAVRDGGLGVRLHDNRVGDAATGIHVRDTAVEVVDDDVTGATRHGVSLIGAVAGSTVRDTIVAGSGPSAVDVRRATGPVTLVGNQVESWDDDLAWWGRLGRFLAEHVMLGVWALALLVPPLVGRAARRRARRDAPVPATLPDRSQALPVQGAHPGTRVTVLRRW